MGRRGGLEEGEGIGIRGRSIYLGLGCTALRSREIRIGMFVS